MTETELGLAGTAAIFFIIAGGCGDADLPHLAWAFLVCGFGVCVLLAREVRWGDA